MAKIAYKTIKFTAERLEAINFVANLVEEYAREKIRATARTIYYQLVTINMVTNEPKSYQWVTSLINDARLAGLIDWDHIVDMTREVDEPSQWDDPAEAMDSLAYWYRVPKWDNQEFYPVVLIEKDALKGVMAHTCRSYQVPLLSCRGYPSQTVMQDLATRLGHRVDSGQTPVVLYFGDHDPSGLNMTPDIEGRLEMFIGEGVEVKRMALNMDQVELYNPPPNPAKINDPRAKEYLRVHGPKSWELDALKPAVLRELLEVELYGLRDDGKYEEALEQEREGQRQLNLVKDNWERTIEYLDNEE